MCMKLELCWLINLVRVVVNLINEVLNQVVNLINEVLNQVE